MATLCDERGVKLLCYGTVLGGLLSEKWIGRPQPQRGDFTTVSEAKVWCVGGSFVFLNSHVVWQSWWCMVILGLGGVTDGFVSCQVFWKSAYYD